ncbi:HTH-type transcriptional activator CmpR [Synechocystis sp. B12]|nr:HTH-type transcriptional activator CmpR [Synechocystis sp. B12]
MKNATLHQFEVFAAIARTGSFTKAAEELFLTQPTVSQQMKQLTKAIGVPLYEQIGRKIYLTEAGQAVLQASQNISSCLDQLQEVIADLQGLKKGNLRLATITTGKYFVPRLLGEFRQQYPGISISLQIGNRQQILERLANNLDDLYFLGKPPSNLDINIRHFLENPLVVIASRQHPLVKEKKISLERLVNEPLIMRESGSGTRMAVEEFFSENRLKMNVEMEISSNEAIKQAVYGGLGISILSLYSLALEGINGLLAVLDVEGFPLQKHWYIIYQKSKQLSIVAETFLDYLFAHDEAVSIAQIF